MFEYNVTFIYNNATDNKIGGVIVLSYFFPSSFDLFIQPTIASMILFLKPSFSSIATASIVVVNVFNSFGKGEVVSENLMDAVTAVSGSSPAYVFMMIEAMADAAVIGGMPRSQAYTFAAQAVLGSAKMVLKTGKHPGELKDMVCSPLPKLLNTFTTT